MVSVKQSVSLKKKNKNIQKSAKVEKLKKRKPKKAQIVAPSKEIKKTTTKKPPAQELKKAPQEPKKAQATPPTKVKYVMPSKAVTEDVVNSCLNALLTVVVNQDKQKNAIFDDEKPIFAELHCMKIQNTKGNLKFRLPHSTIPSTGEVCLVTPDIKKGRKHDHEPTIDRWEEMLKKAGVTRVKTILPVRQLRVEYDQFELKRRLLTQHDFIMVDTRVLNHVSHLLGKMFFKKHNMLIPVRMDEENVKRSIDEGLQTAIMRLSEGETSTITIGHTAMPQEKVKENILALVQQLQTKYPGGEANIRAISIKLPLSVALPLYLTLRPSNTVQPPRLTQKRPKNYTVLEDELSTLVDKNVRVAPDGHVKVKKIKKNPQESKQQKPESEESNDEGSDDNAEESGEEDVQSDASE